ncbi:MAG: SpoIID/LytB domain-containing protein [Mangrovibacterium sp.]
MNRQPLIHAGILAAPEISFELSGIYTLTRTRDEIAEASRPFTGFCRAILRGEEVKLILSGASSVCSSQLTLTPASPGCSFLVRQVSIGIAFHWEQQEDLRYSGSLRLLPEDGLVRLINLIRLETYLESVISSEMRATSSPELLKAHAVISRSWLLAQLERRKKPGAAAPGHTETETPGERIRWYDREDHRLFDVCADDHCQRYQGTGRILSKQAIEAVQSTYGEVLISAGAICDARFSKCCGGMTENFERVWEPVPHSYLTGIRDAETGTVKPDLSREKQARKWIRSNPPAFCNTQYKPVLTQVLPQFDRRTTDFYRWKVSYSQEELANLLLRKTGTDFGTILRLDPVERGVSGRLVRLRVTGSKQTLVIGKELEIRKALSPSHLYSSAFVVDYPEIRNGIPRQFLLHGAGWGHGVGLCQIGAAVMAEHGFSYRHILAHYFRGAELKTIYKP